jgi:hypothetical protein
MAPTTTAAGGGGSNLLLASIVALSVYVPFEWIAKTTLLACVYMFIVDPIPPYTRILSVISTLVVSKLNAWHSNVVLEYEKENAIGGVAIEEEPVVVEVVDDDDEKKDK